MKRKRKMPASSPASAAPRRELWILGAILLVAAGLRAGYLAELTTQPDFDLPLFDARYNDYWARAIVTGDFTPPAELPDPQINEHAFFRPPGYPYFLAGVLKATGMGYAGPRVVQMLLGLGSVLLTWLLARRAFGAAVGLVAAALVGSYWGLIYFEGELQAPALLVPLLLGLLLLFQSWTLKTRLVTLAGAGLMLGLLAVCRPNALILLPGLVLWLGWVLQRRRTLRRWPVAALILVFATLLPIVPVTLRNYVVERDFVPISANVGINLYMGNNPHTSLTTPRIPEMSPLAGEQGWSLFTYPQAVARLEHQLGGPLSYADASRVYAQRARKYMWSAPGTALSRAAQRMLLLWGPREVSNNKVLHYERANSIVLRWLPAFPLASSGLVLGMLLWLVQRQRPADSAGKSRNPRQPAELVVLLLLTVALYSLSFAPFLVAGRFRIVLVPPLLLLTAYGMVTLVRLLAARSWKPAVAGGLAWAGAAALACVPWAAYQPHAGRWHLDRASAWRAQGDHARALDEYHAAIDADATYPQAYAELGGLLVHLGRPSEALRCYRDGLALAPGFVELRRTLAELLTRRGRIQEAIREYEQLVQQRPDDAQAWYALGRALKRNQAYERAQVAYQKAIACAPQFAEARVNLAILLQNSGALDQAEDQLWRAAEDRPGLFEAQYNLGVLLARAGRLDEAARRLQRALELEPEHPAALKSWNQLQQELRTARGDRPRPTDQPDGRTVTGQRP